MPTQLKYVDPARQRSWFSRAYAAFGSTRRGAFISPHVFWKLDPFLLRATRGRLSMALVIRTGLLETRRAKTGALRRNAIIYFHDGDRVTVAASNAGSARQPAWYHNLRAHPDVSFGGIAMRATVVSDEAERQRLWTLADRVFPPYAKFRRNAARLNRTIPIIQLAARESDAVA
jgi:deazaflavin-dependent oxidoreductase (nitroreductase family)